jgi:hypothetical protein
MIVGDDVLVRWGDSHQNIPIEKELVLQKRRPGVVLHDGPVVDQIRVFQNIRNNIRHECHRVRRLEDVDGARVWRGHSVAEDRRIGQTRAAHGNLCEFELRVFWMKELCQTTNEADVRMGRVDDFARDRILPVSMTVNQRDEPTGGQNRVNVRSGEELDPMVLHVDRRPGPGDDVLYETLGREVSDGIVVQRCCRQLGKPSSADRGDSRFVELLDHAQAVALVSAKDDLVLLARSVEEFEAECVAIGFARLECFVHM